MATRAFTEEEKNNKSQTESILHNLVCMLL